MEEKDKGDNKDFIDSLIEQRIKILFKKFLSDLEQIHLENKIMLQKVEQKTSKEFADDINSLTEEKFQDLRKKVLGKRNDCYREISSLINCFDLQFNQKKFERTTNSRKIIKKTIFAPIIYEK